MKNFPSKLRSRVMRARLQILALSFMTESVPRPPEFASPFSDVNVAPAQARRALAGSARTTRHAGSRQAASDAAAITRKASTNVPGSRGLTL
jgi:hypothetical protein